MKKIVLFCGIVVSTLSLNAQTVSTIGQTTGNPSGIAVDASGFVYIAERAPASKITKLNQSTGITSVFSSSGINDPADIEIGPNNQLFIADFGSNSILKVPSAGGAASVYVSGANQPTGLTFDGDTLYFIEYTSQLVYKILPGGGAVGGSNVIQVSDSAFWMGPNARGTGITMLSNGNLFITSVLHYYEYEIDKHTGDILSEVESIEHTFFGASQLSDGNLYMPGNSSNKIYKWIFGTTANAPFCGSGVPNSVDGFGSTPSFSSPYYIANDANDNLYVTDYSSKKIRKISNTIASFNELDKENISIYPNPTNSILTISMDQKSTLIIYSTEGKQIEALSGASNYTFDTSLLDAGVYFIQSDNGRSYKFIKN